MKCPIESVLHADDAFIFNYTVYDLANMKPLAVLTAPIGLWPGEDTWFAPSGHTFYMLIYDSDAGDFTILHYDLSQFVPAKKGRSAAERHGHHGE